MANEKEIKIAYIYYSLQFFVKQDKELLSKHFEVYDFNFKSIFDIPSLIKTIKKSDVTYSWFAGGHAFLTVIFSKILRKKSIVVAGGGDVASEPKMNYGEMRKGKRSRFFSNFVLKYADVILPVSDFTKKEVLKWQIPKKMEVVYNGIDTNKIKPLQNKKNIVTTIANRYKLKGIKTFIETATNFPSMTFVVIGSAGKEIHNPPSNVVITREITHDEVIKWLSKSKIYCQLSYYESFGMGLTEAMACECIPIVTNRGALPEVVGDVGIIVSYGDIDATIKAIEESVNKDAGFARKRVISKFELDIRREKLIDIIRNTV